MNTTGFVKYAGALLALAVLSACGGAPALAPSAATLNASYVGRSLLVNGRPVTAVRLSPLPTYATIVPDRHGSRRPLSTSSTTTRRTPASSTIRRAFRRSGKSMATVVKGARTSSTATGRRRSGTSEAQNQITDTRFRTRRSRRSLPPTLFRRVAPWMPAATLQSGSWGVGASGGDVVIYKNASGSGTAYATPLSSEYFDGYDTKGNLFADGFNSSGAFELVELPKGSSKFEDHNEQLGGVPWLRAVGRYLRDRLRSGHE